MVIWIILFVYIIGTILAMAIIGPLLAPKPADATAGDWVAILLWPITCSIILISGLLDIFKSWEKIIEKLK